MLNKNDDEHLARRRIDDCINAASSGTIRFTRFISPPIAALAAGRAAKSGVRTVFYGGYDGAERTVAAFMPSDYGGGTIRFPVCCVRITNNSSFALSHRDYLGALMSLSVERDVIGDIVENDTGCCVFMLEPFVELVKAELTTVGRAGVSVDIAESVNVAPAQPETLSVNVSSMRFDCIVAAVTNKNRAFAKEIIECSRANLNYAVCENASAQLKTGDVFTIRGYGKYGVGEQLGKSKKDRIFLEMIKY